VYYIFFRLLICVFFFSRRRRHTRFSRDWSSDVCSSDLRLRQAAATLGAGPARVWWAIDLPLAARSLAAAAAFGYVVALGEFGAKIGRASWRERLMIEWGWGADAMVTVVPHVTIVSQIN